MQLVEIDHVSPQSQDRCFCRREHLLVPEMARRHLRREEISPSVALDRPPDVVLGAIRLSAIDQVRAQLQRPVNRRGVALGGPTDIVLIVAQDWCTTRDYQIQKPQMSIEYWFMHAQIVLMILKDQKCSQ